MENQTTKTYNSTKQLYGISFHPSPSFTNNPNNIHIAISSMETSINNQIEIITTENPEFAREQTSLSLLCSVQVKYPITKLEWSTSNPSLLAASSDILRVYSFTGSNSFNQELRETISFNHDAPLTSLSWNPVNPSIIGVSSSDTSSSIYDINSCKELVTLKTNYSECYDIAFMTDGEKFLTCGGDGNIRMFDMRKLNQSNIIYEKSKKESIMKISINQNNDNFFSFISLESHEINIIDKRNSKMIYKTLSYHKDNVNNCIWAPKSNCFALSVSDDKSAILWDVQSEALLSYTSDTEIENCAWGTVSENWVGITGDKSFKMLRVE